MEILLGGCVFLAVVGFGLLGFFWYMSTRA
jgi:hypothetical protein